MHDIAREELESRPKGKAWKVVGSLLSPSHDAYVQGKLGAEAMPLTHRLEMIRLATQASPFLAPDGWEGAQQGFRDFPVVARALQTRLRADYSLPVTVLYLCGSDHVKKCGLQNGMHVVCGQPEVPVVCMARKDCGIKGSGGDWRMQETYGRQGDSGSRGRMGTGLIVLNVPPEAAADTSSTQVRERLAKNLSLDGLVHPDVEVFLLGQTPAADATTVTTMPAATTPSMATAKADEAAAAACLPSFSNPSDEATATKQAGTVAVQSIDATTTAAAPGCQRQSRSCQPRTVFISASYLSREWARVPSEEMDNALFFFGSDRRWVFPKTAEEELERDRQPTDYARFHPEFLSLIKTKEAEGLVHWLKPACDYQAVSSWLQSVSDPVGATPSEGDGSHIAGAGGDSGVCGASYKPLILDPAWWRGPFASMPKASRWCPADKASRNGGSSRPEMVIENFQTGEHDYPSTMELLYQSNRTLRPKLRL